LTYTYSYSLITCPNCGQEFTTDGGILLIVSLGGSPIELYTRLATEGELIDVDDMVKNGYHSQTCCAKCREDLRDLENAEEERSLPDTMGNQPPLEGTHTQAVRAACAMTGEAPPNIDPETGIHYGVIHSNQLDPESVDEIVTNGDDLNYKAWQEEVADHLTRILTRAFDCLAFREQATEYIADMLTQKLDTDMAPIEDIPTFAQKVMEGFDLALRELVADEVEEQVGVLGEHYESQGSSYQWDTPEEGLSVRLCADGDILVLKSAVYTMCGECSPCAPCAGYLTTQPGKLKAYCLDKSWFEDEECPYPYWSVETDTLVYSAGRGLFEEENDDCES